MLPLVSNSRPTCISSASAWSPRANTLIVCLCPSSMMSKSSAVRSVMKFPFLSVMVTPKFTRSMVERNVGSCAATAPTATNAPMIVSPRFMTRMLHLRRSGTR